MSDYKRLGKQLQDGNFTQQSVLPLLKGFMSQPEYKPDDLYFVINPLFEKYKPLPTEIAELLLDTDPAVVNLVAQHTDDPAILDKLARKPDLEISAWPILTNKHISPDTFKYLFQEREGNKKLAISAYFERWPLSKITPELTQMILQDNYFFKYYDYMDVIPNLLQREVLEEPDLALLVEHSFDDISLFDALAESHVVPIHLWEKYKDEIASDEGYALELLDKHYHTPWLLDACLNSSDTNVSLITLSSAAYTPYSVYKERLYQLTDTQIFEGYEHLLQRADIHNPEAIYLIDQPQSYGQRFVRTLLSSAHRKHRYPNLDPQALYRHVFKSREDWAYLLQAARNLPTDILTALVKQHVALDDSNGLLNILEVNPKLPTDLLVLIAQNPSDAVLKKLEARSDLPVDLEHTLLARHKDEKAMRVSLKPKLPSIDYRGQQSKDLTHKTNTDLELLKRLKGYLNQ